MKVYTEVTALEVITGVESSEDVGKLVEFIRDLDTGMQDAEFTEQLIRALVVNLKAEYNKCEINSFLESLK